MQVQKILAAYIFLLFAQAITAQSPNPYNGIGKASKIVTLTKGEYEEFFDEDSVQRIGSAFINVNTMKVVSVNLTKQEQRQLDNAQDSRFLSVDPLASKYPELTPYQFASNMPICAIDLDGLEAKLAIACSGGENTHYSNSDINAFDSRASKLQKSGFTKVNVHTGQMMVNAFKTASKKEGSIISVVSYAHSGAIGIFLDNNAGYYTSGRKNAGSDYSNVDALAKAVQTGEVKFDKGATWVFGSCYTANGADARLTSTNEALAEYTATALNINTVGATGPVYPEVVNGKETGKLKTDGTFKKFEPYQVTTTSTTKHSFLCFNWTSEETKTETKVKVTDLGKTIDPKTQTK